MGEELKYVQMTRSWSMHITVKEADNNNGDEAEKDALKHDIAWQKQVISLKKQITRTEKQRLSTKIGKK